MSLIPSLQLAQTASQLGDVDGGRRGGKRVSSQFIHVGYNCMHVSHAGGDSSTTAFHSQLMFSTSGVWCGSATQPGCLVGGTAMFSSG